MSHLETAKSRERFYKAHFKARDKFTYDYRSERPSRIVIKACAQGEIVACFNDASRIGVDVAKRNVIEVPDDEGTTFLLNDIEKGLGSLRCLDEIWFVIRIYIVCHRAVNSNATRARVLVEEKRCLASPPAHRVFSPSWHYKTKARKCKM